MEKEMTELNYMNGENCQDGRAKMLNSTISNLNSDLNKLLSSPNNDLKIKSNQETVYEIFNNVLEIYKFWLGSENNSMDVEENFRGNLESIVDEVKGGYLIIKDNHQTNKSLLDLHISKLNYITKLLNYNPQSINNQEVFKKINLTSTVLDTIIIILSEINIDIISLITSNELNVDMVKNNEKTNSNEIYLNHLKNFPHLISSNKKNHIQ